MISESAWAEVVKLIKLKPYEHGLLSLVDHIAGKYKCLEHKQDGMGHPLKYYFVFF